MLLPTHMTGVCILIRVGVRNDVVTSSFSQHLFAMPLSMPTTDVSILSPHRHAHAPKLPLVGDVLPPLPFKSSPGAKHHSFYDHAKFIPSFETVKPTPLSSPINNNNNASLLPPLTLSTSDVVSLPHHTCAMQTSHHHITTYTDASHPRSSNSLLLPCHHTHTQVILVNTGACEDTKQVRGASHPWSCKHLLQRYLESNPVCSFL